MWPIGVMVMLLQRVGSIRFNPVRLCSWPSCQEDEVGEVLSPVHEPLLVSAVRILERVRGSLFVIVCGCVQSK